MKPFQVVEDFEAALCEYTGAKYAVTTNSCTMALLLACRYYYLRLPFRYNMLMLRTEYNLIIPTRTYVSVPTSIRHAGLFVEFEKVKWRGAYPLRPTAIWDCARRFTSGMYKKGQFQCVSFHKSKILGDSQGGAILHDDPVADKWFRKARFDGRTEGVAPKDDKFDMLGYHCYISPPVAAALLWKLSYLPKHNDDLPNDQYPDLSKFKIFQ